MGPIVVSARRNRAGQNTFLSRNGGAVGLQEATFTRQTAAGEQSRSLEFLLFKIAETYRR